MQEKDNRPEVPIGKLFRANFNPKYEDRILEGMEKCFDYNNLRPGDIDGKRKILSELIGKLGKNVVVTAPFWCDYGYNITFGDNFYSNHNLAITDGAPVIFGNNVFVAPNCCFTTADHAIDPELRRLGYETAAPITVGNNVWIGAGSIILAGSSIGDNTVIGAGSVVTDEIPSGVVALGVPC